MANIKEFAKKVAEDFRERQKHTDKRFDLELLDEAVIALVEAAFYASMTADESRWPAVSLMCYRKDEEPTFHFLFKEPVEPSPQQIAKLAHAVGPDGHLGCVCKDGAISIGGIHITILDELREFGYSSFRVGNPLRVTIRGPGHLVVSTGGIAMVYKAGEISEEELLQSCDVMRRLAQSVEAELRSQTRGAVETVEDVFNDLAEVVHRMGHGGMILVAPEPKQSQFSSFREIDCLLLQQLLVKYWDLGDDLSKDPGAKQRMQRGEETKHSLRISLAVSMLEKCVSSIGQLAGMDGAIVLDFSLKVVAFNAIITKSTVPSEVRLADTHGRPHKYEDVVRNRGSRHQSALIWTMTVPNSFSFVISQDGAVTAFHNTSGGEVVFERGLRLMKS
jgi:hypothetical protein